MILYDVILDGTEILTEGVSWDHAVGFIRQWRRFYPLAAMNAVPVQYRREAA